MVQYILGIDEGTTSARAFVIDDETNIRGFGQAELTQLYPHPGSIEHDPMQILSLQLEVIRAALRDAGIRPDQLSVAGLTNQRETAVVWAKDSGRPIYNAVVWASRQSVDVVQSWVDRGIAPLIRERTGLIPDAFYAASKIRWILDRIPDAQRRAERGELLAGTVDSWLIWNLTGRRSFVTDYSNASRTMMMNLHTLEWDEELLGHYGIPRGMLAEIVPSDAHFGDLEATFGTPVPIRATLGDQQAGLFGQAGHHEGQAKMTFGTAGVLNVNSGAVPRRIDGLTPSVAWGIGGEVAYEVEGVAFAMGKTMQWLRDELQLDPRGPGERVVRGPGAEHRGRVPGAGVHRPGRTDVGSARARGDRRNQQLHQQTSHHPGRGRVDGLSDPGCPRGGARRLALRRSTNCASTVARSRTTCCANCWPTSWGSRWYGRRTPRPPPLAPCCWPPCRRVFYRTLDELEATWAADRTFEPQMSRDRADGMYAGLAGRP